MQKKKTHSRSFIPVFFVIPLILIIVTVVLFTTELSKNSELILLVAPSKATIKLDNRKTKNGTVKLRSGHHKLEISGEGLQGKTIEFDIAKHETKALNAYALSENGDFWYYRTYDEEISQLSLVADDEAKQFISSYKHEKSLLELLPITVAKEDGKKSATISEGEDCERSYCLEILSDNEDMRDEAEKKLKSLGFQASDYEIKYTRTDSLKNE